MENWSGWVKFTAENVKNIEAYRPGVYQFRVVSRRSSPQPLLRVNGRDVRGIVYIGRSQRSVRSRVRSFFNQITESNRRGHIAGKHYLNHNYKKIFPIHQLQFRYILSNSKKAYILEAKLIQEYHRRFYDLPPLNFQLPV